MKVSTTLVTSPSEADRLSVLFLQVDKQIRKLDGDLARFEAELKEQAAGGKGNYSPHNGQYLPEKSSIFSQTRPLPAVRLFKTLSDNFETSKIVICNHFATSCG